VVAVGLSATELLAEVDEKLPGMTVTLVAPEVAQLSMVLLPAVIVVGLAENDDIVGIATCGVVGNGAVQLVTPPQAKRPPKRRRLSAHARRPDSFRVLKLVFPFKSERVESMPSLSIDCCSSSAGRVGPGNQCVERGCARLGSVPGSEALSVCR
jgi:hypothetical protein